MTQRIIKLYPTPENFQRADEAIVPWQWAVPYLEGLFKKLSREELATLQIENWDKLKFTYTKTLSAEELEKERLAEGRAFARELFDNAKEPSKNDIKRLIDILMGTKP